MPQLRHYDGYGTARFITFSCYQRLQLIVRDDIRQAILRQIDIARIKYRFKLLAYVLMPEHVHLVLHPEEPTTIGKVIGQIKSLAAREIVEILQSENNPVLRKLEAYRDNYAKYAIWLPRCYDHNCRTTETMIEKINYCHGNPVKRGLVANPADWRWSSYSYYRESCAAPIEIDSMS
ncbi:MAG: transposase [Candidatus Zixiibacteriota bacterium]